MICRPTHTHTLSLAFFISDALAQTRFPSFSHFFSLSLLSWYLLIKIEFLDISCQSWLKTLFLLMFGEVYIYFNTHPLTRFQQYPPSHKCHINTPFLRVRYQEKNAEKSRELALRRDTTLSLSSKKNRLRRRPLAALRGFGIQVTVQNLFTTISSKTCTEHVHNLYSTVPSMVCQYPPSYWGGNSHDEVVLVAWAFPVLQESSAAFSIT